MKDSSKFVIYILIILLSLLIIGSVGAKQKSNSGIYDTPGVCEYCNTKLEKTAIGLYGASSKVVWYCPNPDCEH